MFESQGLLALKPPQLTPSPRPALAPQNQRPRGSDEPTWFPAALALRVAWPPRTCPHHHARKEGRGRGGSLCPTGRKSWACSSPLLPQPNTLAFLPSCLPAFLPSVFAHHPAFSNPRFPLPPPRVQPALRAGSALLYETRGSASGTVLLGSRPRRGQPGTTHDPTSRAHVVQSVEANWGAQRGCRRLPAPYTSPHSLLCVLPHPSICLSPFSLIFPPGLPTPALFMSFCSTRFFSLFVSPQPPLFSLCLFVCISLFLCVSASLCLPPSPPLLSPFAPS
uniref:Uncharacterized protein n=1 Tax=Pipistrellus kuhlii TaxID=59472 RepID=A0A7J7WDA3_PIPKU|nr:hypothetical protein mPipKuh1_008042 [Pipistrellus kuhlii]